jgi:hypothetical protein
LKLERIAAEFVGFFLVLVPKPNNFPTTSGWVAAAIVGTAWRGVIVQIAAGSKQKTKCEGEKNQFLHVLFFFKNEVLTTAHQNQNLRRGHFVGANRISVYWTGIGFIQLYYYIFQYSLPLALAN